MRLGVIGRDGEGFVVAGDGLVQLPQALKRNAEVVMRLGVTGRDGEGLTVTGNGLVQLP